MNYKSFEAGCMSSKNFFCGRAPQRGDYVLFKRVFYKVDSYIRFRSCKDSHSCCECSCLHAFPGLVSINLPEGGQMVFDSKHLLFHYITEFGNRPLWIFH